MTPKSDILLLDAAEGWLMLGDPASAAAELARISPASRNHPEVLEVEWAVCMEMSNWEKAFDSAERLIKADPERPSGWIHRAYSVRRMPGGGLPKAWEALRPAVEKFPKEFLIRYNLACYAAQMGRLEEAWDWLQQAARLGGAKKINAIALADEDLESLWQRIKGVNPGKQE